MVQQTERGGTCGITFHKPDVNRNISFGAGDIPPIRRLLGLGVENRSSAFYSVSISTGVAGGTRAQGLSSGQNLSLSFLEETYAAERFTFTIDTGNVPDEFVIHSLCLEPL